MKKLLNATVFLIAATLSQLALATPVTQSTSPAGADSYWYGNGWNNQLLGSISLASGTNTVLALTSTATLVDQGWGYQDPNNGVRIGLFSNGTQLWQTLVAGSNHSWTTQTFDISSNTTLLDSLNSVLAAIDWNLAPSVSLNMFTTPFAYSGWELHVQNAWFSATTDSVPVPATLLLAGLALLGLGWNRRRA